MIIVEDKKVKFWGALDVTARTLEEIPEPFQRILDSGEVRMRDDDIKRMYTYLRRITATERKIRATLAKFKEINIK